MTLTMKSTKTCPLITVFGSKVTLMGVISVGHFAILSMASGFSIMALRGYSVSTMIGKD